MVFLGITIAYKSKMKAVESPIPMRNIGVKCNGFIYFNITYYGACVLSYFIWYVTLNYDRVDKYKYFEVLIIMMNNIFNVVF